MVAVLAGALIYGIGMWRNRHRDRATEQVRDEATERLYHRGGKARCHALFFGAGAS